MLALSKRASTTLCIVSLLSQRSPLAPECDWIGKCFPNAVEVGLGKALSLLQLLHSGRRACYLSLCFCLVAVKSRLIHCFASSEYMNIIRQIVQNLWHILRALISNGICRIVCLQDCIVVVWDEETIFR